MIKDFAIVDFSAGSFFSSYEDAAKAISDLFVCIQKISPAIDSGRVKIIVDGVNVLHREVLIKDEVLCQTLNKIKSLYPKCQPAATYFLSRLSKGVLSSNDSVTINCSNESSQQNLGWDNVREKNLFSLGYLSLRYGHCLQIVNNINGAQENFSHAINVDQLKMFFPSYQKSPKHGPVDRMVDGRLHSAMPLDDSAAEKLMLTGKYIVAADKFVAFHCESQRFYVFPVTSGVVYHGFRGDPEGMSEAEKDEIKKFSRR